MERYKVFKLKFGLKSSELFSVLSRFIIEEIKKRSPIWKKEHYENEDSAWLKGNPIAKEKI